MGKKEATKKQYRRQGIGIAVAIFLALSPLVFIGCADESKPVDVDISTTSSVVKVTPAAVDTQKPEVVMDADLFDAARADSYKKGYADGLEKGRDDRLGSHEDARQDGITLGRAECEAAGKKLATCELKVASGLEFSANCMKGFKNERAAKEEAEGLLHEYCGEVAHMHTYTTEPLPTVSGVD